MAGTRRKRNYLSNANLMEEIIKSKELQEKAGEGAGPGEYLTPKLVNMLMLLVDRYGERRNWCGYSYLDDMKGDALETLMKSALKFDPEKSNNPFAYYTRCIHRCFLTYINKEKQLREIRDDLIEMSDTDLKPSNARQNENDWYSKNDEDY